MIHVTNMREEPRALGAIYNTAFGKLWTSGNLRAAP